jgi:hypothetical protein
MGTTNPFDDAWYRSGAQTGFFSPPIIRVRDRHRFRERRPRGQLDIVAVCTISLGRMMLGATLVHATSSLFSSGATSSNSS